MFVAVYKFRSLDKNVEEVSTNQKGNTLGNAFKLRYDISNIILPEELTWLKYYGVSENKADESSEEVEELKWPLKEMEDPIFSIFELDEDSLIAEEDTVSEENEEGSIINYEGLQKELDKSKPEVLIYSTHTTESYTDVSPDGKDTDVKEHNVSGLGEMLAKDLEENYGIATTHNDTVHNEIYIGPYKNSRETLLKELEAYPDYKLIIDLHRDAVGDKRDIVTTSINGETIAKFMLVDDLSVETIYENQRIMNELISISNTVYPGLCRGIFSYESGSDHFNLDVKGNVIIIELGANCNNFEEAKGTIKYLANIIAVYLNRN